MSTIPVYVLEDLVARNEALEATLGRVLELCFESDDGSEFEHVPGCEGETTCPACWVASIRVAIAPFVGPS